MVFYLIGHLQCSSEIAQKLAACVGKDDIFCFAKKIIVIYGSQKVYFIQFSTISYFRFDQFTFDHNIIQNINIRPHAKCLGRQRVFKSFTRP